MTKELNLNLRTGTLEDPIRIDEKFDVEEIKHLKDRTLYFEKEKPISKEIQDLIWWNNLSVVLVDVKE